MKLKTVPIGRMIEITPEIIRELEKTKLLRVTGSYADDTQTDCSDIDFYIKEDRPDVERGERNVEKIIAICRKLEFDLDSPVVGAVSTTNTIPMLEFSDVFNKRQRRLKEVVIMGVKFKTH